MPYVALGKGLQTAGHHVQVATFENFEKMVKHQGIAFHPIQGNAESILNGGGGLAMAESGGNLIRTWFSIMRSFGALAVGYARDLSAPALWETDLIINQLPGGLYGYDLAEKLGIPMILASVIPLARTRNFPMLAFPSLFAAFPGYNSLTYRIAEQLVWQPFRRTINRWRRETLGLSSQPFWGSFGEAGSARFPIINGFSPQVVPRPAHWGEHIHLTGYWYPKDEAWSPPDDLKQFIEKGPAPVFIGFGSMPIRNPKHTTEIILQALKRTGMRAVLHSGWAGIGQQNLPDNIFEISYTPYAWLFPQMAAVVHHGGSGTTAFGLRAGVPSLIIPFVFDQFYWGARVSELGVGPAPLPYNQLTVDRLADALDKFISDSGMRQRAKTLANKIALEDGIQNVRQLLTQYFG
jgi:UDP:flavonoid glycosyltransferase YjiC (YdhE family)